MSSSLGVNSSWVEQDGHEVALAVFHVFAQRHEYGKVEESFVRL